jgi:hypothetical protein
MRVQGKLIRTCEKVLTEALRLFTLLKICPSISPKHFVLFRRHNAYIARASRPQPS